jgi:lipopolysaccharide/colanic/teichoic acid biosynthesis glycosyltransferase
MAERLSVAITAAGCPIKFWDLWYIDNWSFWLDLWIIVRTCFEVARSRNAY